INGRAELIKNKKFDVVTSRAVTALQGLLTYADNLLNKNGICIFPKGANYQKEIDEAKKFWKFSLDVIQSTTSEEGKILIISNLTKKGRSKCQE
ncbi:MAG: class I SAM-dependent methyltransferase, partial [Alphaproteobacteria bacterium]|nr:class I SAM-dependent methyltransferase [Alphaproteobacteria bacterium]